MPYRIIPVTLYEQNCSLHWCAETLEAAVVDPGGDLDRIRAAIASAGVTVKQILLTHAHIDHAGAAAEFAEQEGLPIVGPQEGDQFWIDRLAMQASMFGFKPSRTFVPTRWLHQGDTVKIGKLVLEVRHCPGHTPGHVVFFEPQAKLAIVGDVLFAGSIGRTDFPLGDHATLVRSIREQLFTLGDEVQFIPGHGPMSTIGQERRSNPFVADKKFG